MRVGRVPCARKESSANETGNMYLEGAICTCEWVEGRKYKLAVKTHFSLTGPSIDTSAVSLGSAPGSLKLGYSHVRDL